MLLVAIKVACSRNSSLDKYLHFRRFWRKEKSHTLRMASFVTQQIYDKQQTKPIKQRQEWDSSLIGWYFAALAIACCAFWLDHIGDRDVTNSTYSLIWPLWTSLISNFCVSLEQISFVKYRKVGLQALAPPSRYFLKKTPLHFTQLCKWIPLKYFWDGREGDRILSVADATETGVDSIPVTISLACAH